MTKKSAVRFPHPLSLIMIGVLGAIAPGPMASSSAQAIGLTTVFDPTNYSQNLLTAAHTLQQINNQIASLQNQAQSLMNQARNLATIDFPELTAITAALQRIDTLMGQAQGLGFKVESLNQQLDQLFPRNAAPSTSLALQVTNARARLSAAQAAFQQTIALQAQIAENVEGDAATLNALVTKSQGAQGALQASQATNQLLALAAKQQLQIQNLMAAQYRADAIEQARRAQSQSDGQAATVKFLGSGTAYTPR